MTTQELDTIHAAMVILQDNGHRIEAEALGAVLVKEAPKGWWSS